MNDSNHARTMYETVPAAAELNKVKGFDPLKFLRRTRDMLKLDLPYQKLWFRMAHPNGRKQAEQAKLDASNTDADEEKRRAEHEAAEAKRKAEWEAKQAEKKKALQEQMDRLAAMSDDDVVAASMQRVSGDVEKLTRRNMKECVSEYIQTLCLSDPAFARMTMLPRKTMIHCFQYINRKALDYIQDELKANGIQLDQNNPTYASDVPDDLCYQWAEDYFRDPDAKEDQEKEEEFVPRPYIGKTNAKKKSKKQEKKKAEPKAKAAPEKKPSTEEQMSLLDLAG